MSRVAVTVVAGAALLVLTSTLAATPQVVVAPGQARDPGAAQPLTVERRIPVGTATLSGTVTNADGRPVVGARVIVSGQIPQNMPATPSGGPNALPARGTPGVTVVDVTGGRGVSSGVSGAVASGNPSSGRAAASQNAPANLSRTVMTDASGQFSFPRMPAGQFTLSVNQNQYLSLNYGQRRTGGPGKYLLLADGQQMDLKVTMLRGGVISGTIFGPDGVPQPNVQVRGYRMMMVNGVRRLQSTGFANSDDRGMYRMFGLQPGDYVVSATPNNSDGGRGGMNQQSDQIEQAIASGQIVPPATAGQTPTVSVTVTNPPIGANYVPPPGYLPTFAPNSPTPIMTNAVTVTANEEKTGVDVFVRLIQASVVQGEVASPLDPGVNIQVMLYTDDPMDGNDSNFNQSDGKGKFTFRSVRPGKYTLMAYTVPAPPPYVPGQPSQTPTPLTDAQKQWGRAIVTVAGEPTIDISVPLKPAKSISGSVMFDMAKPPDLSRARMMVVLQNAANSPQGFFGQAPQGQVGPDGRFTITGVIPGRYQLRLNGGAGILKSAMVGGQETLDFPLEVTGDNDVTGATLTVTDTFSELSGTLTDSAGKPSADYTIVVASTDNRYWMPGSRRIATSRPGPDGHYTFRALPAGAYYLAVVPDLEQGVQYDPDFLRSLATASVAVTMMEGGKVQQDLRVK